MKSTFILLIAFVCPLLFYGPSVQAVGNFPAPYPAIGVILNRLKTLSPGLDIKCTSLGKHNETALGHVDASSGEPFVDSPRPSVFTWVISCLNNKMLFQNAPNFSKPIYKVILGDEYIAAAIARGAGNPDQVLWSSMNAEQQKEFVMTVAFHVIGRDLIESFGFDFTVYVETRLLRALRGPMRIGFTLADVARLTVIGALIQPENWIL